MEEDLLKHQNRAGAAQDGEWLAGEQGVGHARHGRPKQRLHGALQNREETLLLSTPWEKHQQVPQSSLILFKHFITYLFPLYYYYYYLFN